MKICFWAIAFFFILPVASQSDRTTVIGFKGGLNQSYIIAESKDFYAGLELYGGFFADTKLTSSLILQNELFFSYSDDLLFIEIPVLIQYKLNKKWRIFFGPKLDFIVNERSQALDYDFKTTGISASLGGQYHFSKRFFVELRLGQSFTPQINDLVFQLFNAKRRTLRLGFGFNF